MQQRSIPGSSPQHAASRGTFESVHATTFLIADGDAGTVVSALVELGFVFDQRRAVTTTLLDTFDGRLHRAGLKLEVHESDGLELVLSGDQTVPAHLVVTQVPRVPGDLPAGPFRSRLEALTDVRALLPQIRVSTETTEASRRDSMGGIVATARLYEHVRVVDRPDLQGPQTTIEIREVTGYSKRARQAADVLHELGMPQCETDTLSQCAMVAQVDLAGFTSSATVPLEPHTPAVRWASCRAGQPRRADHRQLAGHDRPNGHRVPARPAHRRATHPYGHRRGQGRSPGHGTRRCARGVRVGSDGLTGPARDLDVYLIEWRSYTDPLGAEVASSLAPVRTLLERRRAHAHIDLEQALRSKRAADLIRDWTMWLGEPLDEEHPEPKADRPIGWLVAARIARAHGVLIDAGRLIGPASPAEQVHDLRKDAKKLRYLLECFGSLLPDEPLKRFVKRLKALQDNLGVHQDAEVHVTMLRAVAQELYDDGASSATMIAIGQLTERLDQQRGAARAEFAERFADYDTSSTSNSLHDMLQGITEMKVLATYSIKGGVGKTTTAVNLAHEAAASGARVLLWDLDPQAAATFFVRVKPSIKGGAERLVDNVDSLGANIRATDNPAVHIVPADFSLRHLDLRLDDAKHPKQRLAALLEPLADRYDVALLDCAAGDHPHQRERVRCRRRPAGADHPHHLVEANARPAHRLPGRPPIGTDGPAVRVDGRSTQAPATRPGRPVDELLPRVPVDGHPQRQCHRADGRRTCPGRRLRPRHGCGDGVPPTVGRDSCADLGLIRSHLAAHLCRFRREARIISRFPGDASPGADVNFECQNLE